MVVKALKKNIFIVSLVLLCLSFIVLYSKVIALGNSEPIAITTLEGDESLIRDLEIEGFLGDRLRSFTFNIKGDKKSIKPLHGKENKVIGQYQFYSDLGFREISYGTFFKENMWYKMSFVFDKYYSSESKDFIQISKKEMNLLDSIESKVINISMKPRQRGSFYMWGQGVPLLKGTLKVMEILNDKFYCILPNNEELRGKSSIYEIAAFDKGKPKTVRNNRGEVKTISSESGYRKLADIDLKEGKTQVKGLFGEGDKLYVVIIDEKELKVRVFSLIQEQFIDEVILHNDIQFNVNTILSQGRVYDNKLSLVINIGVDGITKIVTLEYKDRLTVISNIDIPHNYEEGRTNGQLNGRYGFIFDVAYKNDHIYILDYQQYHPYSNNTVAANRIPVYHLNISVFNNSGELKYSGRIETGLNDDYITGLSQYMEILREYDQPSEKRKYYDVRFK